MSEQAEYSREDIARFLATCPEFQVYPSSSARLLEVTPLYINDMNEASMRNLMDALPHLLQIARQLFRETQAPPDGGDGGGVEKGDRGDAD